MADTTAFTGPYRLPPKEKPRFEVWSLVTFAIGTGLLALFALLNLIPGTGPVTMAKALVIAASATLVAYGINKLAIEKGTELAATGFVTAGVVSVVTILAVGSGLFASTFAGLTLNAVDTLRLELYGSELSRFVGERSHAAMEAGRAAPVVRAIVADLEQHTACEIAESCLSDRGSGGRGPVTRALEPLVRRAGAIEGRLQAGETARQAALANLNRLLSDYQASVARDDLPADERRQRLLGLDAAIDQVVGALDEAMPVDLLRAYGTELAAGIDIAERPVAVQRINALLARHAQSLQSVLASIERSKAVRPRFPARAGVSDTFAYIGHFLPIAAITAVVELIFPLALWVYTFLGIVWRKHLGNPPPPDGDEDGREKGNETPAANDNAAAVPARPNARRRSRRSRGA